MIRTVFLRIAVYVLMLSLMLGAVSLYAEDGTEASDTEASQTEESVNEASQSETSAPEEVPQYVDIVVATCDILRGTRIQRKYLTTVSVRNINIPQNAVYDIEQIVNKYTVEDIYEGEYLNISMITDERVSGMDPLKEIGDNKDDYLTVTDYVIPNTGRDVSMLLQEIIDKNPNRTIYFPDGEYVISRMLLTSSNPKDSVSLKLSAGAVIKAADNWDSRYGAYLIASGALEKVNDITSIGSYYSIMGGTLDGNGKTNGLLYKYGRETLIRNVCIKNVSRGITIAEGTNHVSSDMDIEDVTVIGDGSPSSVGIRIIGCDNTFTNVRIFNMRLGIDCGGGGMYKNVYMKNDPNVVKNNEFTEGFRISGGGIFSNCYVENYATAFSLHGNTVIFDMWAKWTTDKCTKQTAVYAKNPIALTGIRADFYGEEAETAFLKTECAEDLGRINGCSFDVSLVDDKTYEKFLLTPIIPLK